MKNVTLLDHPLIAHKITHLCDVTTNTKEFREIVSEIAMLMGYEAFRDLPRTFPRRKLWSKLRSKPSNRRSSKKIR